MSQPLMPKATAVWLIENTSLTFEQVGAFCGYHPLEVQAIADGEVAIGIVGRSPITAGELTAEEIKRCEKDPAARLRIATLNVPRAAARTKGPRYTPVAKRQDKPDGIAWLVRNHPELSDAQISRLLGTTKNTIAAVRDRTHWNTQQIRARHPVDLGLCTYTELNREVEAARAKLPPDEIPAPLPDPDHDREHDALRQD
ncbi:hypothetical protein ABIE65_000628 [Constrictibacter sp. MBR-5]|uniref:DUF1013 domain-containing protein n=1 Tax=Constrictibacter sp. MBR-5 TaxID=3156467 RepID=UPI003392734C